MIAEVRRRAISSAPVVINRLQSCCRGYDRAVRGNYICNDNWLGAYSNRSEVVLRGLDPRIHVLVSGLRRAWMPTELVRGLKAHGTSPAKTKSAGRLAPLCGVRFAPDSPVGVAGAAEVRSARFPWCSTGCLGCLQKESQHLATCIGSLGVGVGAGGAPARPRMTCPVQYPLL